MKAITFLGATHAWETTYMMPDGREHIAPYFGVALAKSYPNLYMKVFVTEEARKMHLDNFQSLVENYVEVVEAVSIPDGRNEDELWTLFETVVEEVDVQEQVIFDITHGFRSLPFLSLLAVAYLREVKDIKLQAVLYGNFEARDTSVQPNKAPVIDLSGFVSLFDWMTAADRFTRFGDAGDLAERLKKVRPDWQDQRADPDKREHAKRLSFTANSLDSVSMALRLIRPNEAMDASATLKQQLLDASQSIHAHARPFVPLVRSITDAYAPLALPFPQQQIDPMAQLAYERDMVDWLLKRHQYVQAVAIAREWIISWVMVQIEIKDFKDLLDRENREEVGHIMGQALREQQQNHGNFTDIAFPNGKTLHSIGQIKQALDIYSHLGDTRNDLLHAGKRSNPTKAQDMEKQIKKMCARLSQLQLPST